MSSLTTYLDLCFGLLCLTPLSTIFQFYRGSIFGSKATRFSLYSHNKQVIALYMSNSHVTGTGLYSHNKQVIALYMSNSRVTSTGWFCSVLLYFNYISILILFFNLWRLSVKKKRRYKI